MALGQIISNWNPVNADPYGAFLDARDQRERRAERIETQRNRREDRQREQEQESLRSAYGRARSAGDYRTAYQFATKFGDADAANQARFEHAGVRHNELRDIASDTNPERRTSRYAAWRQRILAEGPMFGVEVTPEALEERYPSSLATDEEWARIIERDAQLVTQAAQQGMSRDDWREQQERIAERDWERENEGWELDNNRVPYQLRGGVINRRNERGEIVRDPNPLPPRRGADGEVGFATAATERQRFERHMRDLEETNLAANTVMPYAQAAQATGVPQGMDERTVRTNDGILLMTVARMAQGAGVLSDQDLSTVRGNGLDAALADAVGYINGGGQLSTRQRQALAQILIRRAQAIEEAMWAHYDTSVDFALNQGVEPGDVGYREPRVPRPGDEYGDAGEDGPQQYNGEDVYPLVPRTERVRNRLYQMPDGGITRWNGRSSELVQAPPGSR